jgi:hypothetical protein
MQGHFRKSIESDRQVFVVRVMPAVSEFDDRITAKCSPLRPLWVKSGHDAVKL